MPEKLDRCVEQVMAQGESEDAAWAICRAQFSDAEYEGHFHDAATFNADTKTAVSVRDGVLEYMGTELGLEPAGKTFRVYRSPATIANVSAMMQGIPLTDEHVDLDAPPTSPVGNVIDGTMIDMIDETTNSTLAISNRVKISDAITGALQTGKRELSLGYNARLVPYEGKGDYDFEQREIRPHHLAVVSAGRCGPSCAFIDRKPQTKEVSDMPELHKAFQDAEGQMSLEQIVEIATSLPEALKKMPLDKVQEIMPALQEAMAASQAAGVEPEAMESEDEEKPEEEMEDGEYKNEEKDMPVTDTAEFKDAVAAAADAEVKAHMAVVEKARTFVDERYTFADKSKEQIMRDALAAEGHDAKAFADNELSVAFKLLKPSKASSALRNFGDQASTTNRFSAIADKEI